MKIVYGDIFDIMWSGDVGLMFHGCDSGGVWRHGFPYVLKQKIPGAQRRVVFDFIPEKERLGQISATNLFIFGNKVSISSKYSKVLIVNGYVQDFSRDKINLDALRSSLQMTRRIFASDRQPIVYPQIGGNYSANWDVVADIIDEEFDGLDHYCVAVLPESEMFGPPKPIVY
jgi:hypothetical protein